MTGALVACIRRRRTSGDRLDSLSDGPRPGGPRNITNAVLVAIVERKSVDTTLSPRPFALTSVIPPSLFPNLRYTTVSDPPQ